MLDYAKLPGGKYLINWPNQGNDTYLNVVGLDDAAREKALGTAKARTLRFVYFIQHELGFRNLGLAADEFPTADRLALLPFHREGLLKKDRARFAALEAQAPRPGPELWPALGLGAWDPEVLADRLARGECRGRSA
jgi:hypothetical protein